MVDFSPAQSIPLKTYIDKAKAKLNSLEKRHHPNKQETQTNWLKNFFRVDSLSASQISEIRQIIFSK